jgi:hypothetical protein
MKLTIAAVIAAVALSGCASAPTQEQMSKANYGAYPDDWERIVDNHMQRMLRDPHSAQVQDRSPPQQGYVSMSPLRGGGTSFGWYVCMRVNAKNGYGAYVGYQSAMVMINNGRVVYSVIDTPAPTDPQSTKRMCNH